MKVSLKKSETEVDEFEKKHYNRKIKKIKHKNKNCLRNHVLKKDILEK